MLLAKLRP